MTAVTAVAAVPDPEATVPESAVTAHATPAAIAVSVVAVMLALTFTVNDGCENVTVVGNL